MSLLQVYTHCFSQSPSFPHIFWAILSGKDFISFLNLPSQQPEGVEVWWFCMMLSVRAGIVFWLNIEIKVQNQSTDVVVLNFRTPSEHKGAANVQYWCHCYWVGLFLLLLLFNLSKQQSKAQSHFPSVLNRIRH